MAGVSTGADRLSSKSPEHTGFDQKARDAWAPDGGRAADRGGASAIEIWGKRNLYKDPIAVGLVDGRRYLICRWGMDSLLPFETIKRRSGMYRAWNVIVSAANNEVFMATTGMLTFWGSIAAIWVIVSLLQ